MSARSEGGEGADWDKGPETGGRARNGQGREPEIPRQCTKQGRNREKGDCM